MTKLRKKLLLSVLTLALTFIALGSTTFAWFTLGNDATANAFEGTVQGGEGIDIAFVKNEIKTEADAKGYAWAMSINLADFNLNNLKFKDLTSVDGKEITDIKKAAATANTDYVEIELYVRSVGVLNALYLSGLTGVESDVVNWSPDVNVENQLTIDTPVAFNPLNAVRVSFTNKTTTSVLEFTVENNHGSADATEAGLAYKYAFAKKHQEVIDAKVTDNSNMFPNTTKIPQVTNKAVDLSTTVNLLGHTGTDADAFVSYEDTTNNTTYYIYKVTFRVWMEGWDGDCINAILTKKVKLGFTLKANYATQTSTPE